MTEEYKLKIVLVNGTGEPVPLEFKEGFGNGVIYRCLADIKTTDGTPSPMSLADLQDHGYDVRDDMVKIIIEKV